MQPACSPRLPDAGKILPGFGKRGELDAYADHAFPPAHPHDDPRPMPEHTAPSAPPQSGRGRHAARSGQRVPAQLPARKQPAAAGAESCTSDSNSYVSSASQGPSSSHSDSSSPGEAGAAGAATLKGARRVSALPTGCDTRHGAMLGPSCRHREPDPKDRGRVRCPGRDPAGKPQPWPAYPALRAWRESARECHFYAYAPPNRCSRKRLMSPTACLHVDQRGGRGSAIEWSLPASASGVPFASP